ncbi:condensation domain-containing protein [Chromobacterium vaccinii]|uniref:condensation domain-containing protein n=1 Tax=Chromobacterium vaccinii TaxID=1108595 RepID=UPI003C77C1A8
MRAKSNQEFFVRSSWQGIHLHITVTALMRGPAAPELWRAALRLVLARHDVFRLGFVGDGAEVAVRRAGPVDAVCRYQALAAAELESGLRRLAARDNAEPFDLTEPPLCRFTLVDVEGRDSAMILTFHHALLDGWSVHLLLQQVLKQYGALLAGDAAVAMPGGRPFGEAIDEERSLLDGEVGARRLAWWRHALADVIDVDAPPPDQPRPAGLIHRELPPGVGAGMRAEAVRNMLLAAYALALREMEPRRPLLVNLSMGNRGLAQRNTLGLFSNALPILLPPRLPDGLDAACDATRRAVRDCEANSLPVLHLLRQLRPDLFASHGALGLCHWPARHQFNPRPHFLLDYAYAGLAAQWRPDLGAALNWAGAETELMATQFGERWVLDLVYNAAGPGRQQAEALLERMTLMVCATAPSACSPPPSCHPCS